MPAFWTSKCANIVVKKNFIMQPYTRANKIYQGKIVGENLFIVYTWASKATKELVKENLVVCTGGLNLSCSRTHEQTKLIKEKLWGATCSLYTWASKATKELVKENLVVCTGGLNLSCSRTHEQTKLIKEKLWGATCSLYTWASKATKELVKETWSCVRGFTALFTGKTRNEKKYQTDIGSKLESPERGRNWIKRFSRWYIRITTHAAGLK